jgi:hypothetical protein
MLLRRSYPCTRATCKGASGSFNSSSQVRRRLGADDYVNDDSNSLDCWRISANKSDVCQSDALQCTAGAIGPLCGGCDVGFFYSSTDLVCQSCSTLKRSTIVLLAVFILIIVVMGLLNNGVLSTPDLLQRSYIYGLFRRLDSGIFRVVWSNYQV